MLKETFIWMRPILIVALIIVVLVITFGARFCNAKEPGIRVDIHNTSDNYMSFNFVRFDHGIPGHFGPAIQYGGGIKPKEILTAKNREPGKYRIRFWSNIEAIKFSKKIKFTIGEGIGKVLIVFDGKSISITFEKKT